MMNHPSCEQIDSADGGGLLPTSGDVRVDRLVDQELLLNDKKTVEARGVFSPHVGDTAHERRREEEDLRLLSRLQRLESGEPVSKAINIIPVM